MKGLEEGARDRWGLDPTVQRLRRIFARLEKAQGELLALNRIPEFDPRLAGSRRRARALLESGWSLAAAQGLDPDEETLAAIYAHLLATDLAGQGLMAEPGELPGPCGPLIRGLLKGED
jgi:hypothetical protein